MQQYDFQWSATFVSMKSNGGSISLRFYLAWKVFGVENAFATLPYSSADRGLDLERATGPTGNFTSSTREVVR